MKKIHLFQRLNERISFLEIVVDLMGTTPFNDQIMWLLIIVCLLATMIDLRKNGIFVDKEILPLIQQ